MSQGEKTHLNHTLAAGSALLAAVCMGMLGYLVRESGVSAVGCAFSRFLIGFVCLSGWLLWTRARLQLRSSLMPLLSGASIALCILSYFLSIKCGSIGIAVFLLYLGPFFASIGEAVLARKMPKLLDGSLTLVALGGLVAIWLCGSPESGYTTSGALYAFASGIAYALYILFNRRTPEAVPISHRTFWQFAAGVIVLLPALFLVQQPFAGLLTGWPFVLTIGLCQGLFVLLLVAYAIKHLPAIEFGTLSYVEPLVGLASGYFIYKEALAGGQLAGCALILASALLQTYLSTRKNHD